MFCRKVAPFAHNKPDPAQSAPCFHNPPAGFDLSGAKVIMACRDMDRAQAAVKDVMESSGNQNVVCMKLDLADGRSIREFAGAINQGEPGVSLTRGGSEASTCPLCPPAGEPRLDILVNNAGVMMCPYSKTADGFEMQIGVNHFGQSASTSQSRKRVGRPALMCF